MLKRLRQYGMLGTIRLARDLVITRLLFPGSRLVRYPFYIRGRRRIRIGRGFTSGVGTRLDAWGQGDVPCLIIGDNVQINDYVHIGALERVEIGDDVLIASRVFISDHNHGSYGSSRDASRPDEAPGRRPLVSRPVVIGRNAWIGEQVCILPGVTLGEGCIVGAGAIVTRDVPPRCIVVGNPARIIRTFDDASGAWVPK